MVAKLKIAIILLLGIFSCGYPKAPKHIQRGFTICYNGERTNIKELINIDGYFVMDNTPRTAFMFYEDGSLVYEFFDLNEERRKQGISNIPLYFEEINNDSTGKALSSFGTAFKYGAYIIKGDTIKVQYVNSSFYFGSSRCAFEVWYKVMDRNTIVEVFWKPIHKMSESDWKNWEINQKLKGQTIVPAKFIPVKEKPMPNFWVKKEDWFWCEKRRNK
jgi:hypothetical protein